MSPEQQRTCCVHASTLCGVATEVEWAQWLSDQLADRGWKQSDLVHNSAGRISSPQVSNWLRGKYAASLDSVRDVCNALGVSVVEGLIAAGYITADEVNARVTYRPPRNASALSDDELLAEVGRRVRRDAEKAARQHDEPGTEAYTVDYDGESADLRNETGGGAEAGM